MSRLYWDDDFDPQEEGLLQGWLKSAIQGRRGQQFLADLVAALDALPAPELISGALEDSETGCCCAFGAVRRHRGAERVPIGFDPEEEDVTPDYLAGPFNVSKTLAWAVVEENEDTSTSNTLEARRRRWESVRAWAMSNLLPGKGGRHD